MPDNDGDKLINFGKYNGRRFSEIKKLDKGYCSWILSLPKPTDKLAEFKDYLINSNNSNSAHDNTIKINSATRTSNNFSNKAEPYNNRNNDDYNNKTPQTYADTTFLNKNSKDNDTCNNIAVKKKITFELVNVHTLRVWQIDDSRLKSFLDREIYLGLAQFQVIIENIQGFLIQLKDYEKACELTLYEVEKIPQFVFNLLNCELSNDQRSPYLTHTESGIAKLFSLLKTFQKESLDFAIQRNGRILLADEMGLGKTYQALTIAANYRDDWPLVIFCPASLKCQWQSNIKQWYSGLISSYQNLQVIETGADQVRSSTLVLIVSYDLSMKYDLTKYNFNVAIVDESHILRKSTTKRHKFLVPFLRSVKRVILLTGTPAVNEPAELFTQLDIIKPNFTTFTEFASRYSNPTTNRWAPGVLYKGKRLADELHLLLCRSIMIRRLKDDVLSELPGKVRISIKITPKSDELTPIMKQLEALKNKNDSTSIEVDAVNKTNKALKIAQIFKETGKIKINSVLSLIEEVLRNTNKLIIFAHHLEIMSIIQDKLAKLKVTNVRIDGSTSPKKREDAIQSFVYGTTKVAILSITACGQGLDLKVADTIIFSELYWVPGQMLQAEDRVCRLGSLYSEVKLYYCIAEKTLDVYMWHIINKKWKGLTSSIDGKTSTIDFSSLETTPDDTIDIFKEIFYRSDSFILS